MQLLAARACPISGEDEEEGTGDQQQPPAAVENDGGGGEEYEAGNRRRSVISKMDEGVATPAPRRRSVVAWLSAVFPSLICSQDCLSYFRKLGQIGALIW